MIVPSIDLQGGQTVQLVGGAEKAIDAGDPMPIAERFAIAGEIAVIDLDAAMRTGSNAALIEPLLARFACRVGGGIRDVASAVGWLDRGARKVILGTAAKPEILSQLPRERVIAALDARHGEVVVEGWQQGPAAASSSGSPSCGPMPRASSSPSSSSKGAWAAPISSWPRRWSRPRARTAASPSPVA